MRKSIIATALAAMLISAAAVSAAGEETAHLRYQLTEKGSLEDAGFNFRNDAVLVQNGDILSFAGLNGEIIVENISNCERIDGDLYTVRTSITKEDVNKTGVYTLEGEEILPCEAASVIVPDNRENGFRFLPVIYAAEQTDNEDEAIIYFTDRLITLAPGEDDILYKGCAKILDVREKRLVEGLEYDRFSKYDFMDLGESFAYEEDNHITIYGPDGGVIWEHDGYMGSSCRDAITVSYDGASHIIDASGKETFSAQSVSVLDAEKDLFKMYGEDGETAIDMNGNKLSAALPLIYDVDCGYYRLEDEDTGTYYLADADGNPLEENVDYLNEVVGGYGYIRWEDDTTGLVTPDGIVKDVEDQYSSKLLFSRGDDCVVLNHPDQTLNLPEDTDRVDALCPALIKYRVSPSDGSNDAYGLIDGFTGEELLPAEYKDIYAVSGYIFAEKDGVYDVYSFETVSE